MRLNKLSINPPIPIDALIHEIVYEQYKGVDSWKKIEYDDEVLISKVRVDLNTIFGHDATQKKISTEAVIFVDAVNSENIPAQFIPESKITFQGVAYRLKKVIPCYGFGSNDIRHWELEVV
ncbi:putative minor capsid protein [Listeria booriae]|uniref:putative minor capsid protein n=1 Tax=Listeria booriae TaxID=1552123 RepID=UPI001628065E|nr:putative minor capsid protein [Listeria booriae]MBC1974558.1 minor capsid protein [Listeria booriae]MBC1983490.1 minor capsid protein [Listeria booriae]MBC2031850.1 minor capsid protein [Listeria booriae]